MIERLRPDCKLKVGSRRVWAAAACCELLLLPPVVIRARLSSRAERGMTTLPGGRRFLDSLPLARNDTLCCRLSPVACRLSPVACRLSSPVPGSRPSPNAPVCRVRENFSLDEPPGAVNVAAASEGNGQSRTRCSPVGRQRRVACRMFGNDRSVAGSLAATVASSEFGST